MSDISLCSPIGLVAGNGSFPIEFVETARARGLDVVVLAHIGEADPRLAQIAAKCVWIKVGELGKIIRVLKGAGVRQAAFAGGIRRVRLLGGVKLDLTGMAMIARVGSLKDDAVLRGSAEELERNGITVIAPNLLLEKSVVKAGELTRRSLGPAERRDALVGFDAAQIVGAADIGQTVVAFDGVVVAVEAVEGTDATLRRAGEISRGKGGVVVKLCKPHQDLRLDLPTVGMSTISCMRAAGLTALVLHAEKSLILDPVAVVREADSSALAVVAVQDRGDLITSDKVC